MYVNIPQSEILIISDGGEILKICFASFQILEALLEAQRD